MSKRRQFVSDNYLIVNLMGLRMVKKLDNKSHMNPIETYELILYYKSQEIRRQYDSKEERDMLYSKIRKELDHNEDNTAG